MFSSQMSKGAGSLCWTEGLSPMATSGARARAREAALAVARWLGMRCQNGESVRLVTRREILPYSAAAGAVGALPLPWEGQAAVIAGGMTGAALARRWRRANPASVRAAGRSELEKDPGLASIMGVPLRFGEEMAAITEDGRLLSLRKARRRLPTCHVAFHVRGSRRAGVASASASRLGESLRFDLLCVDVATPSGAEHRVYVRGGPEEMRSLPALPRLREHLADNPSGTDGKGSRWLLSRLFRLKGPSR